MARLPVEIVAGVSLGLLTAVLVSAVVCIGSFVSAYRTEWRLPVPVVVVMALLGTGAVGIGTAMLSPKVGHVPRFLVAAGTVSVLSVGAETTVGRLLSDVPAKNAGSLQRGRTLSSDALDWVDDRMITVRSTGEFDELDGYPSFGPGQQLPTETSWEFPADLPLSELERRLEDRLLTEYELAACEVSIDEQGRATIAAAPSEQSEAGQIPDGYRAISLSALVPAELNAGDLVAIDTDADTISGTVVANSRGGDTDEEQVTVAVPTTEAGTLLHADQSRIVVQPRKDSAATEAISLLQWANHSIRKVTLGADAVESLTSDALDARVLAVSEAHSSTDQWRLLPDSSAVSTGATAYVVGDHGVVTRLATDGDGVEGER